MKAPSIHPLPNCWFHFSYSTKSACKTLDFTRWSAASKCFAAKVGTSSTKMDTISRPLASMSRNGPRLACWTRLWRSDPLYPTVRSTIAVTSASVSACDFIFCNAIARNCSREASSGSGM